MYPHSTVEDGHEPSVRHRRPVLVIVGDASATGLPAGERVVLVDEYLEIGRIGAGGPNVGSTWCVDDPRVSARHARIQVSAVGVQLIDLGSRNGTFVDGWRVDGAVSLHDRSLILVGGHAAVFRTLIDEEVDAIREDVGGPLGPVATACAEMALVVRKIRRRAAGVDDLLLAGETGVGKEVYARAVHQASGRSGDFVAINCAALPSDLLESELFGYVRGAHSQATHAKDGLVTQAEGGTLLLDEITQLNPNAQAKLLRFLQEREILPLGALQPRRVDVRVIVAVGISSGTHPLRADLQGRLGASLTIPPLRNRREDIGVLAAHFLRDHGSPPLDSAAFLALLMYPWPRNVRELQKILKDAAMDRAPGSAIRREDLPRVVLAHETSNQGTVAPAPRPVRGQRRSPRAAPTRAELEALLRLHNGIVADVARALERQWGVVWRWLRREGLDPQAFKAVAGDDRGSTPGDPTV